MPQPIPIDPGSLRHRISIQTQTATADAFGQPQQTWTTVASAWAQIAYATAREQYANGQLTAQVSHTITARYQTTPGIKSGMRILYAGHTYQVQAVDNLDQRQTWLKIYVLELNGVE